MPYTECAFATAYRVQVSEGSHQIVLKGYFRHRDAPANRISRMP